MIIMTIYIVIIKRNERVQISVKASQHNFNVTSAFVYKIKKVILSLLYE